MKNIKQKSVFFLILFAFQSYTLNFFLTGDINDLIPIKKQTLPNIGKITVLTQPISSHASQEICGHYAVTSSVLRGLKKLNLPMNYNPQSIDDVGKHIVILVNVDALYQAIELKKQGRIKTLIVGPNIMNNPQENNHLLGAPEIDWYIAPSLWTRECNVQEEPLTHNKTAIWYAGIDTEYWQPQNIKKCPTKTILVYWKNEPESFCIQVEEILYRYGWQTIRMHYGLYLHEQYKQALNQVDAAIFISISESQGIALAECWSMGIPTLVWNPSKAFIYNRWVPVSSAPYLTPSTGRLWATFEEFEKLLKEFDQIEKEFSPRKWVMDYMSDEVSIYLLLDIIKNSL